jgi:RNA polymerase sigma factor (sigma-70 family)
MADTMSGSSAWGSAESEEATLVAAIAAGSRESEGVFVARYLPKVRTLLIVRSRNPELALDLQQDVMIEALCALRKGQLREAARLPAFVAGIARNVLNNHFRGQSRLPLHEELPEEIADKVREHPMDSEATEERRRIAHLAISSLNDIDRSILQMTLVDDLKPGVIAERLGLSSDVVRQRKLRATRRVMEIVQDLSVQDLSQSAQTDHKETGGRR